MSGHILEPWEKWEHACKVKDEENVTLRAQVEELRQAIGLLTTLAGDVEMDADHPLEMARRVEREVVRKIEELKRERDDMVADWEELARVGVRDQERAERAEKQLRMLEADLRAETDRVCDMEALLARLVEALERHCKHGMYAGDAELLAAAQAECVYEPKPKGVVSTAASAWNCRKCGKSKAEHAARAEAPELESPNFRSKELGEFAARNYKRINRTETPEKGGSE